MGMGSVQGNGRKRLVSEINVTPLVDVMLVLLIIFMVTAPMMTQGLDVDLPETTSKALKQDEDPQTLTIDKDGKISLNNTEIAKAMVFQQLDKMPKEMKEKPILLRADKDVAYGLVAALMADVKAAGFDKLGMVTQPEDNTVN